MQKPKVIFLPGNGGDGRTDGNWFPFVKKELELLGCTVVSPIFPDGVMARGSYWLPFVESLGTDENTILVGHSSGAVAAMRYAESHKILGSVLVSPCYTDLGEESEKVSGYYDTPWDWNAIKQNQNFIIQFASVDDPFIPISEARYIHEQLNSTYSELHQGHFYPQDIFPELIDAVKNLID